MLNSENERHLHVLTCGWEKYSYRIWGKAEKLKPNVLLKILLYQIKTGSLRIVVSVVTGSVVKTTSVLRKMWDEAIANVMEGYRTGSIHWSLFELIWLVLVLKRLSRFTKYYHFNRKIDFMNLLMSKWYFWTLESKAVVNDDWLIPGESYQYISKKCGCGNIILLL